MCNKRNAEGSDCFTQWRNNLSAKGTPQGGILSPLLSNIVLNELDWWIASQWEKQPAHNIRDHITKQVLLTEVEPMTHSASLV